MRRATPLVVGLAALVAAPAALATSSGRVDVTDRMKVDAGDSVKLFANDDFKVTGTCEDNGGGDFTANTFLAAKRDNLLFFTSDGSGAFDPDFDAGDPKVDITGQDATGASEDYAGEDYNQDFYGEGKGGRATQGRVATGVHLKGAECTFSGIFVGPADSGPVDLVKRMKVDAGEGATIFANDDFKVTGKCEDGGGGDLTANTFLAARRNNLQSFASDSGDADPDFDASDPKVDFSNTDANGTTADFNGFDYYQEFWAEGKNRRPLDGRVATGVHVKGADCTFSGIFTGFEGGGPLHPVKQMRAGLGDKVFLYENDEFKVTGKCIDQGGGDPLADTFLTAQRNNLIYDLSSGGSQDLDFDAGEKIDLTLYDATPTDPFTAYDSYQEFYGEGRGGRVSEGRVATGVNIDGADCTFSGIFTG
jgi:hypothetical protein